MNIQIYVEHIFSIQIRKCSFIFHWVFDFQTQTEKGREKNTPARVVKKNNTNQRDGCKPKHARQWSRPAKY